MLKELVGVHGVWESLWGTGLKPVKAGAQTRAKCEHRHRVASAFQSVDRFYEKHLTMHYEQLYTSCIILATWAGDDLLRFHARRFTSPGAASRALRTRQLSKMAVVRVA
ncbi:hypothetical protein [Burkholderia cenocepacia]|uniref:hypothetical protein n=1 Tax=Burkholderia cenocepacia TaxID=95486 RepID=UPI0013DF10BF|nr:hypothetical protein [Burkholderia cenocepacia]